MKEKQYGMACQNIFKSFDPLYVKKAVSRQVKEFDDMKMFNE